MKKIFISLILVSVLFSSAALAQVQIDISDKVVWVEESEMYFPVSYTHQYLFDVYTPADQRACGGIFVDLPPETPTKFDLYIALSMKSYEGMGITRLTFEEIPDHPLPYYSGDYGYEPDEEGAPEIHYSFSAQQGGFGDEYFLDWQIAADPPVDKSGVYPGSIYLDDPANTTEFTEKQFDNLVGGFKFHGQKITMPIVLSNVNAVPEPSIFLLILIAQMSLFAGAVRRFLHL